MNDNELVEAAVQGDLNAYNTLVLKYQDAVYNHMAWMLADPQDAEDLTQDAFLRAYQKLHLFKGDSFKVWIMRIATNLCIDELRRRKNKRTTPLEPEDPYGETNESPRWMIDPAPSPEEAVEQAELNLFLQAQIHALPADHRAVISLVDILEMNYVDAAAALGKPVGTVKSRLARARGQLRSAVQSFAKEPCERGRPAVKPTVRYQDFVQARFSLQTNYV